MANVIFHVFACTHKFQETDRNNLYTLFWNFLLNCLLLSIYIRFLWISEGFWILLYFVAENVIAKLPLGISKSEMQKSFLSFSCL